MPSAISSLKPVAAALLLCVLAPSVVSGVDQPSEEYLRELAMLQEMERLSPIGEARDISVFQVEIKVDDIQRIVIADRFGRATPYHYLTFRIRNRIADVTTEDIPYQNRYNEVLAQIEREYRGVRVDGNALVVDTQTQDDRLNRVIDRSEMIAHARSLQLTVTAFNEYDTRVPTLDAVHQGTQELFAFDDHQRAVAIGYDRVRKRLEERYRRRLWLPSEIARNPWPPYNEHRKDEEGVAEGEIYGVAIFDRLDPHADRWIFEFRGLSNRMRRAVPVHTRDQLPDFYNTRVMRRMYTVGFRRYGDEYARDLDHWYRLEEGWEWDDTFQRLDLRRHAAMATYFLENIADAQNRPQEAVLERFRDYYRQQRQEYPSLPELRLGE